MIYIFDKMVFYLLQGPRPRPAPRTEAVANAAARGWCGEADDVQGQAGEAEGMVFIFFVNNLHLMSKDSRGRLKVGFFFVDNLHLFPL